MTKKHFCASLIFLLFFSFSTPLESTQNVLVVHDFALPDKHENLFQPSIWGQLIDVLNEVRNTSKEYGIDFKTSILEIYNNPYFKMRSKIDLRGDDKGVIVFDLPHFIPSWLYQKLPKEKKVLFIFEPQIYTPQCYTPAAADLFSKVFTFCDSLVDNKKYFKYHYPVLKPMIQDRPAFSEKKLAVMISRCKFNSNPSELLSERFNVAKFFDAIPGNDFCLYGSGWGKYGFHNWEGPVESKMETLKKFRFSFCYENCKDVPGYITEKIFDCFAAGCVPIYWGANNVTDYIPKECFIDRRDFNDTQEVYSYILNMSEDEYLTYIEAIQSFLDSDAAQKFSKENLKNQFMEVIFSFTH